MGIGKRGCPKPPLRRVCVKSTRLYSPPLFYAIGGKNFALFLGTKKEETCTLSLPFREYWVGFALICFVILRKKARVQPQKLGFMTRRYYRFMSEV